MGNIVSPWRYDAAGYYTLEPENILPPAIYRCAHNQSAQQRPEDPMGAYDFTWLWRELGVGDERR